MLNVELPGDARLPEWQFRLLQAGGYLLELISAAGPGLRTEQAERLSQLAAEIDARRENHLVAPPVADPEARPGWQKIVVRYRSGQLLKGSRTISIPPARSSRCGPRSMRRRPNASPTSLLKAVFFVRDFDGNPAHTDQRTFDDSASGGRRLEVTFADSEVLRGTTLSYRPDGIGFFIKPADERGNNQRVFAISQAIKHVRFV